MTEETHIGIIEIEELYGNALTIEKIILFNEKHLTAEMALSLVRAGDTSPYILVISKQQYQGLFCD